jgi:hypothetical protein
LNASEESQLNDFFPKIPTILETKLENIVGNKHFHKNYGILNFIYRQKQILGL